MIDKDTLSYKKGFAKGIEIYTENMKKGYFADEDNKRCINAFKRYAETGFKKGIKLNDGQRQYFYGMADGIEYKYKKAGTPITTDKEPTKFEKYEHNHYYGNNDNVDEDIFG